MAKHLWFLFSGKTPNNYASPTSEEKKEEKEKRRKRSISKAVHTP